jgi:hypothetical protein
MAITNDPKPTGSNWQRYARIKFKEESHADAQRSLGIGDARNNYLILGSAPSAPLRGRLSRKTEWPNMRLRFSLRALFFLTALIAALCFWFVLPTLTARRFLAAVASEDYRSADGFFSNSDDRFLANWADKRWGFRTTGELLPLTFGQLVRRQRTVRVEMKYFQFDENVLCDARIAATPLGLKKPELSDIQRLGILYDRRSETSRN